MQDLSTELTGEIVVVSVLDSAIKLKIDKIIQGELLFGTIDIQISQITHILLISSCIYVMKGLFESLKAHRSASPLLHFNSLLLNTQLRFLQPRYYPLPNLIGHIIDTIQKLIHLFYLVFVCYL